MKELSAYKVWRSMAGDPRASELGVAVETTNGTWVFVNHDTGRVKRAASFEKCLPKPWSLNSTSSQHLVHVVQS